MLKIQMDINQQIKNRNSKPFLDNFKTTPSKLPFSDVNYLLVHYLYECLSMFGCLLKAIYHIKLISLSVCIQSQQRTTWFWNQQCINWTLYVLYYLSHWEPWTMNHELHVSVYWRRVFLHGIMYTCTVGSLYLYSRQ